MKDRDGNEHAYTGVAVGEILEMAGVTMGKQLRGAGNTVCKRIMLPCLRGEQRCGGNVSGRSGK